jgi:gamma-glutamyltranspeptidase/glutathione hydrolase
LTGTIAAGNPHTAAAGMEILVAGGNAVDAAVAAALATFASEPLLASAGGGAIMLAAQSGGPVEVLDCFPVAPGLDGTAGEHGDTLDFEAIEVDFGTTTQMFHVGRGAAAVPLVLPGLAMAANKLGTLPMSQLVRPAVEYARQGVPMGASGAEVFGLLWPILTRDPATLPALVGGDTPGPQTLLRNPDLADLLQDFGVAGVPPPRLFDGLVREFGPEHGGQIGPADVKGASPVWREPLTVQHRGWQVSTSPRPGGVIIGRMLAELARQELSSDADRGLALARAGAEADAARRVQVPGSTTHISVVDEQGAMAAITLSNGEGCGHLIPGTGVHMNNFLGEEDLNPGGFHRHRPGDPLPTMMAPTLARGPQGQLVALGSGGANRIRSAVCGVVEGLAAGLDLRQAIQAPRVHAEGKTVWFERVGWENSQAVAARFAAAFDVVIGFHEPAFFFGGVHGVVRGADGSCGAVGDARRGGVGLPAASLLVQG